MDLLDRVEHHRMRLGCSQEELVNRALSQFLWDEDRTESLLSAFDEVESDSNPEEAIERIKSLFGQLERNTDFDYKSERERK